MMRSVAFLAVVLSASGAYAAGAPLPKSGTVKEAAYTICRSAAAIDLGEFGSNSSADCNAIAKTRDGGTTFDNLAMHCLEDSVARKAGYKFTGTCVETDGDGDKFYLSYEGPESGPVDVLGGTGKYKGMKGKGQWRVTDAPGNNANLFAFTLDYEFDWSFD